MPVITARSCCSQSEGKPGAFVFDDSLQTVFVESKQDTSRVDIRVQAHIGQRLLDDAQQLGLDVVCQGTFQHILRSTQLNLHPVPLTEIVHVLVQRGKKTSGRMCRCAEAQYVLSHISVGFLGNVV